MQYYLHVCICVQYYGCMYSMYLSWFFLNCKSFWVKSNLQVSLAFVAFDNVDTLSVDITSNLCTVYNVSDEIVQINLKNHPTFCVFKHALLQYSCIYTHSYIHYYMFLNDDWWVLCDIITMQLVYHNVLFIHIHDDHLTSLTSDL